MKPGRRLSRNRPMKRRSAPMRRSSPRKYRNRKVVSRSAFKELNGRSFDSKFEESVAVDLCIRLHAGEIRELRFQQTVHLTKADIRWRIDFSYVENGRKWYHEAKGFPDKVYPLKLKLYRTYGKNHLRITSGQIGYKKTVEIIPKGET